MYRCQVESCEEWAEKKSKVLLQLRSAKGINPSNPKAIQKFIDIWLCLGHLTEFKEANKVIR